MIRWRRRLVAYTAPLLLACASLACASDGPPIPPALASIWRHYRELPEQRALAIAGDPSRGNWIVGSSAGQATLDDAEAEALTRCRARRASHRMQAECVLYAIGDEVVWRGR